MDNLLIDNCLQEIAPGYKPGLLAWLKGHPDRWRQLLAIEGRINEVALAQNEVVLRDVLEDYRLFFEEMTEKYIRGDTLFEDKR